MTWYHIEHCIKNELFPAIQVVISKCVEDKRLDTESDFEVHDIGKDAVDDVIEKLKNKRPSTNNREIKYLRKLVQRAHSLQQSASSLVSKEVMYGCS